MLPALPGREKLAAPNRPKKNNSKAGLALRFCIGCADVYSRSPNKHRLRLCRPFRGGSALASSAAAAGGCAPRRPARTPCCGLPPARLRRRPPCLWRPSRDLCACGVLPARAPYTNTLYAAPRRAMWLSFLPGPLPELFSAPLGGLRAVPDLQARRRRPSPAGSRARFKRALPAAGAPAACGSSAFSCHILASLNRSREGQEGYRGYWLANGVPGRPGSRPPGESENVFRIFLLF